MGQLRTKQVAEEICRHTNKGGAKYFKFEHIPNLAKLEVHFNQVLPKGVKMNWHLSTTQKGYTLRCCQVCPEFQLGAEGEIYFDPCIGKYSAWRLATEIKPTLPMEKPHSPTVACPRYLVDARKDHIHSMIRYRAAYLVN